MAINTKNRSDLKSYFVKNAIPTQSNFADLVDAQLNQADDGVFKIGDDPLSVVAAPGDRKRALQLYGQYPAANPDWTLSLEPNDGTTAAAGFGIDDASGNNRLFLDQQGRLGIGTTTPAAKLAVQNGDIHVAGGRYRRIRVVSDTYWAGIELVARRQDQQTGHPHIDFTHGDLEDPNFGVRIHAPSNNKLRVDAHEGATALGVGIDPKAALHVNGAAIISDKLHAKKIFSGGAEVLPMRIFSGTFESTDDQLHKQSGDRFVRWKVAFSGFTSKPTVVVALSKFDSHKDRNMRIACFADEITASGCQIVLHTWSNTIIYRAEVTWIAYGT